MEARLKRLTGDERLALAALGAIVLITVAWWALALWPVPSSPEWLSRTRSVCFGATPDGLPDGGGWILLIGQPLSMLGFLMVVWGGTVRRSLRSATMLRTGRSAIVVSGLLLFVGFSAAAVRIGGALSDPDSVVPDLAAGAYPLLNREVPPLRLVDQEGRAFELSMLKGRQVLLTFAYAHCETVCPVVLQQTLAARRRTASGGTPVVVVTLDPWRDTPSRLSSIAAQWGLGEGDYVLGGTIPEVLAVLDAWDVPITRHADTGTIDHPARVYVIGGDGRIAFAAAGGTEVISGLLGRTRSEGSALH